MKKGMCALLVCLLIMSIPMAVSASMSIDETTEESSPKISEELSSENVLYVSDGSNDVAELKEFMSNDGIVVVMHEDNNVAVLEEKLGFPFQVETIVNAENDDASGKDIASLYYSYGNGLNGIYIINVGVDDNTQTSELIAEAIDDIRTKQNGENSDVELAASSGSAVSLGSIDIVTTREPKGKLQASYQVFTVQDYQERDHYIVKAKLNGIPGCILAEDNSNYESKYQGEGLHCTMSTSTNSVTIDTAGPGSTESASSYTVEIGGQWAQEGGFSISGGFSYTKSIADINIAHNRTSNKATWDLDINRDAQKRTCSFEPAATFECPSTKTSVSILLIASYDLDSWDTFSETISSSRTVTCTASSMS